MLKTLKYLDISTSRRLRVTNLHDTLIGSWAISSSSSKKWKNRHYRLTVTTSSEQLLSKKLSNCSNSSRKLIYSSSKRKESSYKKLLKLKNSKKSEKVGLFLIIKRLSCTIHPKSSWVSKLERKMKSRDLRMILLWSQ